MEATRWVMSLVLVMVLVRGGQDAPDETTTNSQTKHGQFVRRLLDQQLLASPTSAGDDWNWLNRLNGGFFFGGNSVDGVTAISRVYTHSRTEAGQRILGAERETTILKRDLWLRDVENRNGDPMDPFFVPKTTAAFRPKCGVVHENARIYIGFKDTTRLTRSRTGSRGAGAEGLTASASGLAVKPSA